MDYCFHTDLNALASRGFRNETIETFMQGFDMAIVATFFPAFFALVGKLIDACSEPTRKKYFPGVYGFESMQTKAREGVEDALARAANGEESTGTMFDAMARPDGGKGQEKVCKKDMVADGCLMIAAGTDTTAHALCTVLWYVTQDRQVSDKLLAELKRNVGMDEIVGSATLEGQGFEYLRAVVKEGLRLSYGVPGRIIRRVPREGARFREVWVPGGVSFLFLFRFEVWLAKLMVKQTIITSSIYMQNMDPTTFPDPHRFDPERWMCDAETYKLRDKQMVSYSRGSRSCVGMK
jgi:cytochrome P450